MKRLACLVFAALIPFVEWIPAQSQSPQTPLGPPTEMFEATDLAGNPVPTYFYLTGGGAVGRLLGPSDSESLEWSGAFPESGVERDWSGNRLDGFGFGWAWNGAGDITCSESMASVVPWPVNLPLSDARCWHLDFNGPATVAGAVAPLTMTSAGGSLVFHDWEVVDPESGRCRTGNMGVRAIPDHQGIRGTMGAFAEGVEYRARGYGEDHVSAKFRAVYAPAFPDVSAPLISVDTPRDCWEIPRGAAATVSFSCRDLGDGIASCNGSPEYDNGAPIDTSAPGEFSFDVVATDLSGNTRTRTVRYSVVDVTAPTASPSVPPVPSSGWYNSDVTVTWNWSDDDGGIGLDPDNCPATTVSSGEGAAHLVSATCRDNRGNVGTSSVTIAVDKTPPQPQGGIMVLPDPVIQGQSARVIFTEFVDNASGFASLSDQFATCDEVVTSVPGNFSVACSNTDRAGNTGTVLVPYTVTPLPETTNPTISIATPAASAIYQRYQSVSAAFTCSDEAGGSGIASCVGTATVGATIDTASLGTKTFTVTATDYAGNTATINASYQIVDATIPTISIVGPPDGATYLRNQAVTASYSCNDEAGGSGIASCAGPVLSGAALDTSSAGPKTFTVTAIDNAGNTTVASRSYSVIADYTFGGFAQPVDPAPTVNAGKAGKTYPVKFQLFDLGVPVSDLAAVTGFTYKSTSCDALNVSAADALETSVAGNTVLRYDAATSAFVYNWKTPSTPGCYALWLTLRTNQQFAAYFQLK